MAEPLHVFLAGIIQGSLPDSVHDQGYREEIARFIREHVPEATIYDPFAEHPESLSYDGDKAREVYFELMDRAAQADLLISFVPEASMGTAIEMWNAFHAGAVLLTVSPLMHNWVIRFLSDAIFPDTAALRAFLEAGKLETLLEEKIGYEHYGDV